MLIESELLVEVFQPDTVHVSLFGGGACASSVTGGVTVGHADAIPAVRLRYCPHMRPCVCSSPLPLFFIRTHTSSMNTGH